MKLDYADLFKLRKIAEESVLQAGHLVSQMMNEKIRPMKKDSCNNPASQVVTEVDFLSQQTILERLDPFCKEYDIGILAEESEDSKSRFDKDFFWCVDPLDGTLLFVDGLPGFSVSIALVSSTGESIIGAVYDPSKRNLYTALKGNGLFKNNLPWLPTLKYKCSSKLTVYCNRGDFEKQMTSEVNNQLQEIAEIKGYSSLDVIPHGGAVMSACEVIENAPACYFKFPKKEKGGGCLWDFAATNCFFNECSAWVSDIFGNPLDLNRHDSTYMNHRGVLFASCPELAKDIMTIYRRKHI